MVDSRLNQLLHGSPAALPEQVPLRAGRLDVIFEAGDLRCLSLGGRELVRRIYGAVRDRDWVTIPGRLSDVVISSGDGVFSVRYVSEHRDGPIDFVWRAKIDGGPDGTITFAFSGEARRTFERNRIGLCVLHPIRACAGRPATARLTTGREVDVRFPELVALEQPIDGFSDLAGLAYAAGEASDIEIAVAGDTFETEDQRNWVDASYKTYSTRVSLPRPVVVPKGTRIEQQVTIRLRTPGRVGVTQVENAASVVAPVASETPMPRVGVTLGATPSDGHALALLRDLRLAHVRVDLPLAADGWEPDLDSAIAVHHALGCGLELALSVGAASEAALAALASRLPRDVEVHRVLVFDSDEPATTPHALDFVRSRLVAVRPDLGPLGAGSRVDLFQLHASLPPAVDLLCWPINPHAHASDVTSLAETPPAAGDQVRSVRARHPRAAAAVTPVTLGPRTARPGDEPHPLHGSLFGAAWTLAMASHLAKAGTASVTFLSDVRELGCGGVSPLFHVLADLCECAGGTVAEDGNHDDTLGSLLVRRSSGAVLLLANLTRHRRTVTLPPGFVSHSQRVLDATTAARARDDRQAFRREPQPPTSLTAIELNPFATARLDGELAT